MLNIPLYKTATGQRTFNYRTVKLWNSLDLTLKLKPTLTDFKCCLIRSLISTFLDNCIFLLVYYFYSVSLIYVLIIIIQISYTVRIPIFRLVDLYHVALGYDETTSLTSLSWCNTRGVHSIHHCHYTMASADSKFDDFCLQCIQFE